jgi:hypothetical protein
MATKEEILQYIKTLAAEKILTREEIITAYDEGSGAKPDHALIKKLGVSEILYYIGGAIIFIGISVLLWQNWSTLSALTRVLATLGSGVAAYFVGILFGRSEKTDAVGQAFYLISALVTPIGFYVVFDNAGFDAYSLGTQSLISGILLGAYLLSYLVFRRSIFVLFSILFGTWFFFVFTGFMTGGNPVFADWEFFGYRTLVAGLAYILLGYSFAQGERSSLSNFLYGFGILGFLGAALALGGWEPHQNAFWELIFPGLVFAALFLSVYLKSKSFLTFGSLYLMAYIVKITSEYFSSGLGWPLALVLAGLMMIGVGYMSIYLKRKYISS